MFRNIWAVDEENDIQTKENVSCNWKDNSTNQEDV